VDDSVTDVAETTVPTQELAPAQEGIMNTFQFMTTVAKRINCSSRLQSTLSNADTGKYCYATCHPCPCPNRDDFALRLQLGMFLALLFESRLQGPGTALNPEMKAM
jgi:hypothetical protein